MNTFVVVIIISNLVQTLGYNIVGVFPHMGKSHVDVFLPLMKALARKGHNVTVISHFPLSIPIHNYKDVNLGGKNIFVNIIDLGEFDPDSRLTKIGNIFPLSYVADISCEAGLRSPALQNFTKTKETFDVLITEFFNSDCFLGLEHKIRAPIIGLSSSTLMPWTSQRFANPTHTAYIPNNNLDFSDKMTFFQRLENTLVTLLHQYYYEYFRLSQDERLAREYLGRKAANVREYIKNSSLLLVNTHFSLNLPRPLVPNVVEVGGIHIRKIRQLSKVRKLVHRCL